MELQLGPLIDTVFLMLTYFLFTITLTTIEGLLPSELASGDDEQVTEKPQQDPKTQVIVRVVQTGASVQYFIDDWPVTGFDRVTKHLEALDKQSMIVLDAGGNVAYEHVVALYNLCLRLEIANVVFPIEPTRGGNAPGAAPRS